MINVGHGQMQVVIVTLVVCATVILVVTADVTDDVRHQQNDVINSSESKHADLLLSAPFALKINVRPLCTTAM